MSQRHKIVYCEGNLDGTVGGSYFSLLFLVSGLDRDRFEPVVVFRRENDLIDRYRDSGVEVVVIPPQKPVTFGLGRQAIDYSRWLAPIFVIRRGINFLNGLIWDAIKLAWWLRKQGADLVHLNNSVTRTHSWMLAARMLRIPCVTHERGMNTRYCTVTLYLAPRLSRVICISNAVKDNLVTHNVTRDNLVLIYNAIDPDSYRPALSPDQVKRQLTIGVNVPVIGMVGNIRAWKGQDIVVTAVAQLRSKYPDIVCVFVGQATDFDQPFLQRLKRLANELGVENNLRFTGYQNNVADYTSIMDVVIHASIDPEPFGRVLIEAMSLGKPVVGARAGAVPEILDDPNCGLTFPPGDDVALARAIDRLLADPMLARKIGEAAQLRVRQQFDIQENIRSTERVYSELLAGK